MRRVDINAVNSGNFVGRIILEVEGIEKSTLVKVQSIDLMTGGGNDRVTRGVVISNRSTGLRYPGAVVETALVVQRDRTIVLKVQCLRPVIGKDLESYKAVSVKSLS